VLELDGVACRFGERVLFADLCLSLASGATVAVRGPSGAGKSLLMRAIAGFDPIQEGAVRLEGRAQDAWPVAEWRARVAWVPQAGGAPWGSPADLVAERATFRARRGAPVVDPRAFGEAMLLSARSWDQPWRSLSGGERQRVLLALAISGEPDVLLLDEPTSALDAAATAAVERVLAGRTALWVTHDVAQAARVATATVEVG